MNPEEIPIPLEKTVEIKNGIVEVSVAEKKMTDKEKKVYRKFMAKCVTASKDKSSKDAMLACAVDFEKVKEKLMAEDEEEDEEDEMEEMKKEEEEDEEEEEEEYENAETLEEKIKIEEQDVKDDQEELKKLREKLKKKKAETSESAQKSQTKMEYREKPKTSTNSVGIITVEQINKWEREEKNETKLQELKETKTVWKNTVDL